MAFFTASDCIQFWLSSDCIQFGDFVALITAVILRHPHQHMGRMFAEQHRRAGEAVGGDESAFRNLGGQKGIALASEFCNDARACIIESEESFALLTVSTEVRTVPKLRVLADLLLTSRTCSASPYPRTPSPRWTSPGSLLRK